MRSVPLALAGCLVCNLGNAQTHWVGTGVPIDFDWLHNVYNDTTTDALYLGGIASSIPFNGTQGMPLMSWKDQEWDTLAVFGNEVRSVLRWGDTLVVAGVFETVNGDTMPALAGLVDGQWTSFGQVTDGGMAKVKIIDGDLFALGGFSYIDGHLCNGIAKRLGGQWVSVGPIMNSVTCNIQDLTKYNGQLVATGAIHFTGIPYSNIMIQAADSTWGPVGPNGLLGGFSSGRCVTVYQGDLYVGGSIPVLAGNAGHGIMRWDGNQWNAVGGGLTYLPNNYTYLTGAIDFLERDGLLFVAGSFNYADGNLPATGVATWDGAQWCGLGGTLDGPVNSIAFYHDTLYAACFHNADGIDVNCAAKFIGSSYADTCGVPVGLAEQPSTNDQPLLWPNPASEFVTVSGQRRAATAFVYNALGRLVLVSDLHQSNRIDVRDLSGGMYLLVVRNAQGRGLARTTFLKE
ncbi:MAG: T9SS type A sorting domain-containing protein [Flavobacteriales bacterium]|nr:MAG: T9SS type A sorting domain-containing protein [Flavobacteriales bacterium]